MKELERVFKALGQTTRLKIVLLLTGGELCVCELEQILGLSQSAVSQHMRVLKSADLVVEERRGQWVFYSLNLERVRGSLQGFEGVLGGDHDLSRWIPKEYAELIRVRDNPIVGCRKEHRKAKGDIL